MALYFRIETDIEDGGRWIAQAIGLPGVLAYGSTEDEAIRIAGAIALRVIADRMESQQIQARGVSWFHWVRVFTRWTIGYYDASTESRQDLHLATRLHADAHFWPPFGVVDRRFGTDEAQY